MSDACIPMPFICFSRRSFKLSPPHRRHQEATASTSASSSSPPPRRRKEWEQELREVFRHFDVDHDGKISVEELRASFVSIGEEMAPEMVEAAVADLDKDGDGLLDFEDFLSLMERGGGGEEDLKMAFEAFEGVKGSGRITPRGLQRVLSSLGDERPFEDCEAMIRAYDLDGNGELDFLEFHRMMS